MITITILIIYWNLAKEYTKDRFLFPLFVSNRGESILQLTGATFPQTDSFLNAHVSLKSLFRYQTMTHIWLVCARTIAVPKRTDPGSANTHWTHHAELPCSLSPSPHTETISGNKISLIWVTRFFCQSSSFSSWANCKTQCRIHTHTYDGKQSFCH